MLSMGKKEKQNACAGFTLVEILIVIALIALAGMIAAPRVANNYRAVRFNTISDQLLNDLRFARKSAMDLNTRIEVKSTGGVNYTVTTADGSELLARSYPETNASWGINLPGGSFFFNRQGLPENAAGAPLGGNITITNGSGGKRTFTLFAATGMIR